MKRTFLALVLGLIFGIGAHFAWFLVHRPESAGSFDSQFAWMKSDLKLSDAQLAHIKTLHEQSSPRLMALAAQVAKMRREFTAFENARLTEGQVDFLEFARFVEQQRALDRECAASTRGLIAATAGVMTPQQREQYLSLVSPAFKNVGTGVLQ